MNSVDGPEAMRGEVQYLRGRNERLREEIARLRAGPASEEDRRTAGALRLLIAVLWIVGTVSVLALAFALLAFLGVAAGGLKG